MIPVQYQQVHPTIQLLDFVESFWMLNNSTDEDIDVIVIPDGRIDVSFSYSADKPYHVRLNGLENGPVKAVLPRQSTTFAISFRLLALEYLLNIKVSNLINGSQELPLDFLKISPDDLIDFDSWRNKVSTFLIQSVKSKIDPRKINLFKMIYSSNGELTVASLAKEANWSSRQINRYFNDHFGLPLKAYCNILRFKTSFRQIREGSLYPEQNFTDQAHFIREVKRFSGVSPKELSKNQNDRFIQLSVLPRR